MRAKFWGQAAKQNVDDNKDLTLLGNFKLFLSPSSVATYYGVDNKELQSLARDNHFINTISTEDRVRVAKSDDNKKYRMKKDHDYDAVDAVDIISDYLKVFHTHAIKQILKAETKKSNFSLFKRQVTKGDFNIRYVLTVPAMWSASAKETMAQASIDAGIITKDELHNLLIITEPEAAALYCDKLYSKFIRNPDSPEDVSNFVVCDAGGGTVDLVTFQLNFTEDKKPIIYQVGEGSGDTCGSSYLDSKFKTYLLNFYKDLGISASLEDTNFNSVMDRFINDIKVGYNIFIYFTVILIQN